MSKNCKYLPWAESLFTAVLFVLFITPAAWGQTRLSARLSEYLEGLKKKGNTENTIGFYVADAGSGKEVFSHNGSALLIPASVLKVITTVSALKNLHAGYRFPTEVFVDSLPMENNPGLDTSLGLDEKRKKEWKAGNIYFRGYGDPTMVTERLWDLVQAVRARGIEELADIVIDDTLFVNPPRATGPKPYQAALSAVSLNSNCYTVTVAPGGQGALAFVSLAPGVPFRLRNQVRTRAGSDANIQISQLPFSASFTPGLRQEKVGQLTVLSSPEVLVDVRGVIGIQAEAETHFLTVPDPAAYIGMVFRYLLERSGVKVNGRVMLGETPSNAKLLLVYESKPLAEILRDLNHYSSNYVAGQIVYAMGQDTAGYFRREIGLEKMTALMKELGYDPSAYKLVDASGLDRGNRLSAEQLVKALVYAYRDFSIAPDMLASFSRFGNTGTLKKRKLLDEKEVASVPTTLYLKEKQLADGVWAKTGTLDGVSSLAGYLENKAGDRLAFAIVTNGPEGKEVATEVEDELVKVIVRTD
jgi:serine-type D-Ala-D-Ala carboxypeptidase/endopeptidase (penicillin-binding protein 4)